MKPILGASLTVPGSRAMTAGAASRSGVWTAARRAERGAPASPAARQPTTDTHIVLLAQDAVGYANLCRLITDAHMLGERSDPSVSAVADLCARGRVWSRCSGPRSAAGRLAVAGRVDAARVAAGPFREAFGR